MSFGDLGKKAVVASQNYPMIQDPDKSHSLERILSAPKGRTSVQTYMNSAALETFAEIERQKLDARHTLMKYTIKPLAYVIPAAVVVYGSLNYLLPAVYNSMFDLVPTPSGAFNAAYGAASSMGFAGSAALAGGVLLDRSTVQLTSLLPKAIFNMCTYVVSKVIWTGIAGVGTIADNHFAKKEQTAEKTQSELRNLMVDSLVQHYRLAAHQLLQLYKEACVNPSEMYNLKKLVEDLNEKRADITQTFSSKGLSASDNILILRELQSVMDSIKDHELTFNDDANFNAKLLLAMPVDAFEKPQVPFKTRMFLENGKQPRLGVCHKMKSAFISGLAGVVALPGLSALACVASSTCSNLAGRVIDYASGSGLEQDLTSVAPALVAVPVISYLGYRISKSFWDFNKDERRINNDEIDRNNQEAFNQLKKTYDGMAEALKGRTSGFSQQEISDLREKVSLIDCNLQKYSLSNPKEITKNLRSFVKNLQPSSFIDYIPGGPAAAA